MLLSEAVYKRIENLCDEKKITLNRLATVSCLTQSTLNNIRHSENTIPNLLTLQRICNGLEITLGTFFQDPIFKNIDDE